jgi:hypothetical protein
MNNTVTTGQPQQQPLFTPAQRKWVPAWVIAAGVILAAVGWILGHTTLLVAWQGGTASQVNGICTSAAGQLGQVMIAGLRGSCSQIALYEQASGWLIILGVLTVAGGIAWTIWQRQKAA